MKAPTMPTDESHDSNANPLSDIVDSEADYDEQLGRKMGEAARQVQAGEMTEAEFYDRFHDAVLEEFGVDDRPVEPPEE
jgi:molybdopterin-containing oxidoreductase family iron-sulfur binding subunit